MTARVLVISTGLARGGAEAALARITTSAEAAKSFVAVVSLGETGFWGNALRARGIEVYSLDVHPRGVIRAIQTLRAIISKHKPDIVQGWMYHGNLVASLIARVHRRSSFRVVWGIRNALHEPSREKITTRALIRVLPRLPLPVDRVIYNSNESRRQHESIGYSAAKGIVIPNGVDCSFFWFDSEARLIVRQQPGIETNELVIRLLAFNGP